MWAPAEKQPRGGAANHPRGEKPGQSAGVCVRVPHSAIDRAPTAGAFGRVCVRVSLLPESATFEELVQECFLAHRGAGLMLSPLDVQLIGEWAETGVPFEVVARGVRKAAEKALWDARPGEPVLRTLRACRRSVEAEIRKYRARSAGAGTSEADAQVDHGAPGGFAEERHRRLRAAVAKLGREEPRLSATCERLSSGLLDQPSEDLRELDRREDLVIALLIRALSFDERIRLYHEAAEHAGDPNLTSAAARKLSRRFHRQAVARRALSVPAFW